MNATPSAPRSTRKTPTGPHNYPIADFPESVRDISGCGRTRAAAGRYRFDPLEKRTRRRGQVPPAPHIYLISIAPAAALRLMSASSEVTTPSPSTSAASVAESNGRLPAAISSAIVASAAVISPQISIHRP